jgi:uncharacterized protein
MNTVRDILDNYAALCGYCDSFFGAVSRLYKKEIRCKRGCTRCCELHAVCALEARALVTFLYSRRRPVPRRRAAKGRCALLAAGECLAYPARPVICRTHGVALLADKGNAVYSSCDLNFTSVHVTSLPRAHVFDTARITGNLIRLNMAFCMAAGEPRLASERFTMERVRNGNIPESILSVS